MANGNGLTGELEPFAAAVRRLSGGTLRIEFKSAWREGTPGYETGVIGDVKAGKADLAWAGSRAFDSVGVAAFDALHAPLLIDSYALERRALQSPLVREMLGGLKPLGVVGLGILPGPLRKPLGVSRLVGPADYAGKTLAFQRSRVAEQTLRALGARGAEIPFAGAIDAYDGVEQEIAVDRRHGYDAHAKYLTTNVNLWPRPVVIFMNRNAFDKLNGRQRTALHDAARVALPATLAIRAGGGDRRCGEPLPPRRALRHGRQSRPGGAASRGPARLRPARARRADQGRDRADPSHAVPSGLHPGRAGMLQHRLAAARHRQGHADRRRLPRPHHAGGPARRGSLRGEVNPENYGSSKMVLDRGRVTQQQPAGDSAAGTYTVAGHTVTLTFTRSAGGGARTRPGEVWYFGWSLYRDQLTLAPVPGKVSPAPMLRQAVAANRQRALIRNAMMPKGRAGSPAGARSLCRDLDDDPSARSRRAVDAEPPAERLDAISETAQSRPASRVGAAHAVVDDLDDEPACVPVQLDPHERRARVFRGIGERLGAYEVHGGLDGGGEAPGVHTHLDRDRRAAGELRERRGQSAGGQRRGVDPARQLAQLRAGRVELGLHVAQQR